MNTDLSHTRQYIFSAIDNAHTKQDTHGTPWKNVWPRGCIKQGVRSNLEIIGTRTHACTHPHTCMHACIQINIHTHTRMHAHK